MTIAIFGDRHSRRLVCALTIVDLVVFAEPIKPAVPDVARPLPLTAVRLTGGPLKHAQDLTPNTCSSWSPIA